MHIQKVSVSQRIMPSIQHQEEKEEIEIRPLASQITPLIRRQPEEEDIQTKTLPDQFNTLTLRQAEQENKLQSELLPRQRLEETKAVDQTKLSIQREEQKDENVLTKSVIQSQVEEEEPLQGKFESDRAPQIQQQEEEEQAQSVHLQVEDEEKKIQTKLFNQDNSLIQKQKIVKEEEEIEPLQIKRKENKEISAIIERDIFQSKGSGQSLDKDIKETMEPRFGYNFSNVRIHKDSNADKLANQLGAQAFTVGKDIYFGAGRYDPGTTLGQKLIGHELTHVVQQGGVDSLQPTLLLKKEGHKTALKINKKAPVQSASSRNYIISDNQNSAINETPDIQCGFFGDLWEGVKGVASDIWEGAKDVGRVIGKGATAAWNWIKDLGRAIGKGVGAAWEWIKEVGRSIGRSIVAAWGWIKEVGRTIGSGIAAAWEWIKEVGRAIGRGIVDAWEWIKEVGRSIGRGIVATWEWIKDLARKIKKGLLQAWEWIKAAAKAIGLAIFKFLACFGPKIPFCLANLVQTKLEINRPGDIYEQEADRMADKVLRIKEKPAPQNKPAEISNSIVSHHSNDSLVKTVNKSPDIRQNKNVIIKQNIFKPFIQRYGWDVHYNKTYELAVKIGFDEDSAKIIAIEDQDVDEGDRDPLKRTPREFIDWRIKDQDLLHFPARSVAVDQMNAGIKGCDYKIFGTGLHRYQDSYSHNFETWNVPFWRICASCCWLVNPVLAAAVLMRNPAHGRWAVMKHACLLTYPDQHNSEQLARDEKMHEGTKFWLDKFFKACPDKKGKGLAASAGLIFTSEGFNKGLGGAITATPSGNKVAIESHEYETSGKVKVSGGTDTLAQEWEAGFIQTMSSAQRRAHYKGSKNQNLRTVSIPGPRRDALVQSGDPWYDPNNSNGPGRLPFKKTNTSVSVSLWDRPGTYPPWNTPDGKGKLDHHTGKDVFTAWMIVRNKTAPNDIKFLNWTSWSVDYSVTFNYATKGNKTIKKITGKSKNTGFGKGQGKNNPVLGGDIANTELNRNIVWS